MNIIVKSKLLIGAGVAAVVTFASFVIKAVGNIAAGVGMLGF